VILTTEDHRRLVLEGVNIFNGVNDDLDPSRKTFELIGGDPHTIELKTRGRHLRIFRNDV